MNTKKERIEQKGIFALDVSNVEISCEFWSVTTWHESALDQRKSVAGPDQLEVHPGQCRAFAIELWNKI